MEEWDGGLVASLERLDVLVSAPRKKEIESKLMRPSGDRKPTGRDKNTVKKRRGNRKPKSEFRTAAKRSG
jgi:hypothetical protein